MKKLLKKVIVMVTAVMMLVGLLPAAVMATEDATTPTPTPAATTVDFESQATLTINKTDSARPNPAQLAGATFAIYKIASLSRDNTSQLTYTVEDAYEGVITQADLQTLGSLGAEELEVKASAAAKVTNEPTYTASSTTADDGVTVVPASVTIPGSNFGLYLIVETQAPEGYEKGMPFFVDIPRTNTAGTGWDYVITVNAKNAKTQVTKVIELADGTKVPADTVKPGDIIKYVVEGTIPYFSEQELAGTAKVEFTDTMKGGLALKVDGDHAFTVKAVNPGSGEYDVIPVTVPDDGSTTISFEINKDHTITIGKEEIKTLETYKGQKIQVTYYAVVTDDITANVDAVNSAEINATPATEQPNAYTFAIKINKTGSDNRNLKGVEFELYYDNNGNIGDQVTNKKYVSDTNPNGLVKVTTGDDGSVVIDGLDADNNNGAGTVYWLKETKTVSGYTLLAKPVKVELIPEVVAGKYTGKLSYKINNEFATTTPEGATEPVNIVTADRTAVANIVNNKGFSLPSTGGMGTYIFTIGGIVIMAAAAVVLVAMKKRNRA